MLGVQVARSGWREGRGRYSLLTLRCLVLHVIVNGVLTIGYVKGIGFCEQSAPPR